MNAKTWHHLSAVFFLTFFGGIVLYNKIPYAGYIVGASGILFLASAWMYDREKQTKLQEQESVQDVIERAE